MEITLLDWIDSWYNQIRRHTPLDGRSPVEFEFHHTASLVRPELGQAKQKKDYMRSFVLLFLVLIQFDCFAEGKANLDPFNRQVKVVEGDLNKDSLVDKVVVMQDTSAETAPYRLQVFFKEPNGDWRLIISSIQIIAPQYPDGRDGYRSGDQFDDVTIKNGILSVRFELLRGQFEHKFRFQNGCFELIGFSMNNSDGHDEMTMIDFNLSTGVRIEKTQRIGSDKILSNTKKKVLIRPLPKLQDIVPLEKELY